MSRGFRHGPHLNASALGTVFHRVAQKVEQHLMQLVLVRVHVRR